MFTLFCTVSASEQVFNPDVWRVINALYYNNNKNEVIAEIIIEGCFVCFRKIIVAILNGMQNHMGETTVSGDWQLLSYLAL